MLALTAVIITCLNRMRQLFLGFVTRASALKFSFNLRQTPGQGV